MIFRRPSILVSFITLIFFAISFFTLGNYGVSWDEPTHFKRGQGYLWYLLTGDNDYSKLPPYDLLLAQTNPSYHARSIYQDDKHNAAFYRTIDGTHPPLADILASATNMIFYQKLGLMSDVESYHLFEIFVASLGVGFLFLFVLESFGLTEAVFSTILFATYPLFWAESHFNIKDPIETSWIILTIYFFWKGIKSSSARMLFASSIFAGFAFATKWNVIFLPLIVIPWLLFIFKTHKKQFLAFIKTRSFILVALLYPLAVFAIFYASYPFLWEDSILGIGKVLTYYQRNALNPAFANAVLPNWPFYALRWVLLSAPPLVLLGFIFNLIFLKRLLAKHYGFALLVFLWFAVTILRVTIPGVNIYGGTRQIMEYIPAISTLAGVGLAQIIKLNKLSYFVLLFAFVSHLIVLVRLHPNENVYFNFLAGGLKGATDSGVPAAGNSFGNAYHQGLSWLNENALPHAKLTLIQGSAVNIPKNKLRGDIDLSGDYFSGINREGEYLMELVFNHEHKENFYAWEYVGKFLVPVYEVKADNVPILKIWKNDLEHTKPEYKLSERIFDGDIAILKDRDEINIEIQDTVTLSRFVLSYEVTGNCSVSGASVVETSLDGNEYSREKDPLTFLQVGKRSDSFRPAWESPALENSAKTGKIEFYFAGRLARFTRLVLDNENSCVLKNPQVRISYLE